MKRPFLCLILVFVLLVSLFCPVSFAAEADNPEEETKYFSGDYTYAIVKGGGPEGKDSAKIVSFNSDSTNVAVPEALDGLPGTHIGDYAFFNAIL